MIQGSCICREITRSNPFRIPSIVNSAMLRSVHFKYCMKMLFKMIKNVSVKSFPRLQILSDYSTFSIVGMELKIPSEH